MTPIRLIAMDMDGTLLSARPGVIPPANAAALWEARRRGIHLAIASGRVPDDAGFHALDAGLPMHILALNGAVTLAKPLGPVLRSDTLPEAEARRVRSMLDADGLPYAVFACHDLALSHPPARAEDLHVTWGTFMDRPGGRTAIRVGPDAVDALMPRVSKFVVTAGRQPEQLASLRRRIARDCPALEVTSSWVDNIEINAQGVNKGAALTRLAASLAIPMEGVMAIGDNDNDLSMLRAAGCGVAMGNATPAALACARYVTLTNTADGVAAAIRALVFGENIPGVQALR